MDLTPDYSRVASPVSSIEELLEAFRMVAQFYNGDIGITQSGPDWAAFRWTANWQPPENQIYEEPTRPGDVFNEEDYERVWEEFSKVAEDHGWSLQDLSGDWYKGHFSVVPNMPVEEHKNLQRFWMH